MKWNRVFAIILRHYYLSIHQIDRFFGVFFYPTVSLVLWGFLSKYVQRIQSSQLAGFLLGGLILWIIFENVDTEIGLSFMFDIWERNIVNTFASPIKLYEYLGGFILISVVKILITLGLLGILASVFYNFRISSLGFGLALFWVNLVIFGWAFGIFNLSLVLRFGSRLGPLTWSLPFLLQPFSAVFYPVSVLPKVLQNVSFYIPISHVFEGMRYTLATNKFDSHQFFLALFLNLIYMAIAIFLFISSFRAVKRNGQLVKLI